MLSETHLGEVGNFNTEAIGQLRPALGGGIDAVSGASALDLTKYTSELTISGTIAYTLAAPTVAGQRKKVICVAASNTPLGTVTISSPDNTAGFVCATTWTFDTVGQGFELIATTALKWRCVRVFRAGTSGNNGVVIGTTVLTGKNLWSLYICSVTGTVSSTTTKALPDGSAVGEIITVSCSTAALSPSGTLGGNYVDLTAAARTGMVLDATTDTAVFMWNGSGWQAQYNTATYS